jgi:hypothetical protein
LPKGKGLAKKKRFCHKVKVLPGNRGLAKKKSFSKKGLTKKQRVFVERQKFS